MRLDAFAPAKVNLYLHVGPVGADGYHPLSSLMVFADVGDRLAIQPADAPEFVVDGPFAAAAPHDDDNIVIRAVQALLLAAHEPQPPFRLHLRKELPVAAGLGGGSSDAAATLRLVSNALDLSLQDEVLSRIAAGLGSDVPACLSARPVIGRGRGDQLSPAPALPPIDAVLVNPGARLSTAAVYRAFDETGFGDAMPARLPDIIEGPEDLAALLSLARNDLEGPAIVLAPVVGEVLDTLRGEPETLIARMSGSGATCFAICAGDIEAENLAERLQAMRPDWWVRRCRLGRPCG